MRFNKVYCFPAIFLIFTLILIIPVAGRSQDGELPPGEKSPPDVFSRLAEAGEADDYEGAEHVIVLDKAVNRMKPSGVTYVDAYTLYKILTPAGARDMSVLRWNYDPQSSHVEVREVNIIRGGRKTAVDVSGVHDLPAPQSAIYWNDRIMTLQLPRLMAGDGIEVTVFRKGFTYALLEGGSGNAAHAGRGEGETTSDDEQYIPPMPGEYFDIVYFSEEVPVVEKRYMLDLPADKRLHSQVFNGPLFAGTTYEEGRTVYEWWGIDLPARVHEPGQPDRSDFVPKVVMATAESWEAKSRWFFDVNRDQFEVTPAIGEKVEEILKAAGVAKGSEERKAEVLLHWVAQNIRYSGQTMGKGEGFTLHSGEMIFRQRSGVCKDIAGMLVTMMRAAGMDSYAAMTMAGSRIEDLPADQFNHCVCALKKDDGSFEMYDPTWVPYNNNIWSLLEAEQHYLVGTPEGEYLSRIAYSPAGDSPLGVDHSAVLEEDGTLSGTFRLYGSGAMDSRLRGIVNYGRKQDIRSILAAMLAPVSERVEIVDFSHHVIDDFSGDMWLSVKYRIPRFAFRTGGGFEFRSPMMQVVLGHSRLFRAASLELEEERETDVFLYYTQSIDGTEKIRLPNKYSLKEEVGSDEIDETYAYFKGTGRMQKKDLVITQKVEIRRRQIPPGGYGGFRNAIEEAKEWGRQVFRIEKGGK